MRFADGRGALEESIGKAHSGMPLFKVSRKWYHCTSCGYEKERSTNHYGNCWPRCEGCGKMAVHRCRELDFDIIIKRLEEKDNANRRL